MPGYSGTPLPKKLGLKPGLRIALSKMPDEVRKRLKASLDQCKIVPLESGFDLGMLFAVQQSELEKEFQSASKTLEQNGSIWVGWPKKSSGVKSDLDENSVRRIGLQAGLVDVKVCAVTDVWSGLKFVRRLKDRK